MSRKNKQVALRVKPVRRSDCPRDDFIGGGRPFHPLHQMLVTIQIQITLAATSHHDQDFLISCNMTDVWLAEPYTRRRSRQAECLPRSWDPTGLLVRPGPDVAIQRTRRASCSSSLTHGGFSRSIRCRCQGSWIHQCLREGFRQRVICRR